MGDIQVENKREKVADKENAYTDIFHSNKERVEDVSFIVHVDKDFIDNEQDIMFLKVFELLDNI